MATTVTESWIPIQWWSWQNIGDARTGPGTLSFYNPNDPTARTRWVRMVRYHLHISGIADPNVPGDNPIDDTGVRLLNETVDLIPGLDADPTAIPPQFSIVSQNCSQIWENADNSYYSQPRVQRVTTTTQLSADPSQGMPSAGLPGVLAVLWPVLTLPAPIAVGILQNDNVAVIGGPPITD